MVRGFVYSFVAVCVFLLGCILWMLLGNLDENQAQLAGGWLLLLCFFLVGPVFFAVGYWHHLRLHPREPRWDAELGE